MTAATPVPGAMPLFALPAVASRSTVWESVKVDVIHEVADLVAARRYAKLTRPDPESGVDLVLLSPDQAHGVLDLSRGHPGVICRMLAAGQLAEGPPFRVQVPAGVRRARLLILTAPAPVHPLSTSAGPIALHRSAGPYGHSFHLGLRCGQCAYRQIAPPSISGRAFPKCAVDDWRRASQSVTTDVFSYWPACEDYQRRDEPRPGSS